jgi:subtilisin family serine protease
MVGKTVALRKHLLGAIASGLLLVGGVAATPSLAADAAPAAVAQKVEGHNELWSKLTADPGSKLPVIVQFSMPALPDAATFANAKAADEAQTKAIHAAQDNILGAVLPSGTLSSARATEERNLKRMDFSPMFGILADADDLAKLAANPNVTVIQEDVAVPPSLIQSLPIIQMPAMYSAGATGNGYHVAILDTGGRRSHQFLSSRIVSEACYNSTFAAHGSTSRCPGGANSSVATGSGEDCTASNIYGCGHGTHVAGTAAGFNTSPQSGQPSNGVARDARIISINIFSQFPASQCGGLPSGYNSCVLTYTSDQISGLERVYALRNTYNIASINMSLGGGQHFSNCDTDSRKSIIDQLKAARIATIIAAGNDGFDSSVGAPGCISSAVTVASSTKSNARSSFSNWGSLIDVVAPGSDILASDISGSSNSYFGYKSGTSMASPHVTGAFAALRTAHPNATVDQIENALKSTGSGISSSGVTKPRINVNSARIALGGGDPGPTGPANDNFANRIAVAVPAAGATRTVTGSNVDATAQAGEPFHAGLSGARNSVWWRYTPAVSGSITITTAGSGFDTVLAVYTGSSVGALSSVASNDDAGGGRQSSVTFSGTAGTQYQIAVAGYSNAAGNIRLNVTGGSPTPPPHDDFEARRNVNPPSRVGSRRTVNTNNHYATAQRFEPHHAGRTNASNSVWYRFTPQSTGRVVIDTRGSDFNTVLAVYVRNSLRHLTEVASNNDYQGLGRQSRLHFRGQAGRQYQIAITGYGNRSGNIRLNIIGGEPGRGTYTVGASSVEAAPVEPGASASNVAAYASDRQAQSPARLAAAPIALQQDATARPSASKSDDAGNVAVAARSQPAAQRPAPSASSNRVELVSTVVTPSNDGVLRVPAGGGSFSSLAVNNAGADATLTAELSLSPVAGAASALPAGMSICRTDPATSTCIGARATSVTFEAASNTPVTFAAFVDHQGSEIAYDPATRLYVHFRQGSAVVGTASVSVCTVGTDGCEAGRRQTAGLTRVAQ